MWPSVSAQANNFNHWNTVLYTFINTNVVHRAAGRTKTAARYRGVYDAAVNVYLNRFLTTPPAPGSTPDPKTCLEGLRLGFETHGEVNRAGRAVPRRRRPSESTQNGGE